MKKEVLLICPAPQSCRVKPGGKPIVSRFFRHTRLSLLAVAAALSDRGFRAQPASHIAFSVGVARLSHLLGVEFKSPRWL